MQKRPTATRVEWFVIRRSVFWEGEAIIERNLQPVPTGHLEDRQAFGSA
jgi:hypothetical protein